MRNRRKNNAPYWQGALLVIAMVTFAIGMFPIFSMIDCYRSTKFVQAYEACQENENCELKPWHKPTYDREVFLQGYACKKD